FAYALYKQGYAADGWKALSSLYKMASDTGSSKIYPCLPEYFDLRGRGMYSYLTGSASWFMLTMLTQVFGVRGRNGDLVIEPKLSKAHFSKNTSISIGRTFAGRRIKIVFLNPARLDFGRYRIAKVRLNSENLPIDKSRYLIITREVILDLPANKLNVLELHLG
ncbi:MAG: cellobiose phosphorylase, partial [Candidatus Omnitrophica bacterium]|nr:cellobiose phosphorylase [Candidatus Omnitrophota bacterium]